MAENRVVHFEIPSEQPAALAKFYGDLFGWQFGQIPVPGIELWHCPGGATGPGIGVAVIQRQNATQPPMNYVEVASIDDTIAQAVTLGAVVALPRMPIPDGRAIAAVIDPQGNLFGLMEASATK